MSEEEKNEIFDEFYEKHDPADTNALIKLVWEKAQKKAEIELLESLIEDLRGINGADVVVEDLEDQLDIKKNGI